MSITNTKIFNGISWQDPEDILVFNGISWESVQAVKVFNGISWDTVWELGNAIPGTYNFTANASAIEVNGPTQYDGTFYDYFDQTWTWDFPSFPSTPSVTEWANQYELIQDIVVNLPNSANSLFGLEGSPGLDYVIEQVGLDDTATLSMKFGNTTISTWSYTTGGFYIDEANSSAGYPAVRITSKYTVTSNVHAVSSDFINDVIGNAPISNAPISFTLNAWYQSNANPVSVNIDVIGFIGWAGNTANVPVQGG